MADLRLRIPPEQLSLFRQVLQLSDEEFASITSDIESLAIPASIDEFRDSLILKGHDKNAVESLSMVLVSLASLVVTSERTASEVLDAIHNDLVNKIPEWFNEPDWTSKRPRMEALISPGKLVYLLSKAFTVSSQGTGLVISSRIFTETRWVFSDLADTVVGAVTRHVLMISHVDNLGNDAVATFFLDDEDLEKLRSHVERAQTKAKTIAALTETTKTPTFHP